MMLSSKSCDATLSCCLPKTGASLHWLLVSSSSNYCSSIITTAIAIYLTWLMLVPQLTQVVSCGWWIDDGGSMWGNLSTNYNSLHRWVVAPALLISHMSSLSHKSSTIGHRYSHPPAIVFILWSPCVIGGVSDIMTTWGVITSLDLMYYDLLVVLIN